MPNLDLGQENNVERNYFRGNIVNESIHARCYAIHVEHLSVANGIDEIDFSFLMRTTIGNICVCITIYNYIYI